MVDAIIVRVMGKFNHFHQRVELPTNLQRFSLYVRSPDVDSSTLEEMLGAYVQNRTILANSPLLLDSSKVDANGCVTVVFSLGTEELYESFKREDKIPQEEYFMPNGGYRLTKYRQGIGHHSMTMVNSYQRIIQRQSHNQYRKITARFKRIS